MLNLRVTRGFTIIELMVALTILGIAVAMVIPTFGGMIQNSKIGSSAKSYQIGIQTARAEAIRRNLPVEFVLTQTAIATGIENSAVPSANGQNWVVRYADASDPACGGAFCPVESKSAQEGSGRVGTSSVLVSGAATAPSSATFTGILTFNRFGGTLGGETVVLAVSNPDGGACATVGGPMRCQQVQVRPGGQISVCDPNASANDSRYCQP